MMKTMRWLLPVLIALSVPATAADKTPQFAVKSKTVLGGEGGWDYLTYDPAGHRLFITRGTHVMVVDAGTLKVTADIPDTLGVHGVALAPELGKGFISAGRSNKAVVFDLASLKTTGTVEVGNTPDAIAYEPKSKRVFTLNARSQDATVVDAKTDKVVGTVPLGGKPEFAVADGAGHLYVNIETTAEIAEIDASGMKVMQRWKMAGCEEPTGLALDDHDHVLFAGCSNKTMAVVDAKSGKELGTLPIGAGVDAVAYDPKLHLAFSSNGEGTMTVVGREKDKWAVLQTVATQRGARTMTLDPATHQLYLVTASVAQAPPTTESNAPRRPGYVPGTFTLLVAGPAEKAADLKLDEIIRRNLEARGGVERLKNVLSQRLVGHIGFGDQAPGPFTVEMKRPGKMRETLGLAGGRTIIRVTDGKEGWISDTGRFGGEAQPLSEEVLRNMAGGADYDGPLVDPESKGNQVALAGTEMVEGNPAYKLKITLKDGDVRYDYIDSQSFLEVRWEGTLRNGGKESSVASRFRDYRRVDGIMYAFAIDSETVGTLNKQKITFDRVEVNSATDDARFSKPVLYPPQPPTS